MSPSFIHGKDAVVYQDGNDLTGYLRSLTNSAEVETAESTTFADDDKTYITGVADATISAEGLFDATFDGNINSLLGSGTKSVWSIYPAGDAVGNVGRGYSLDVTKAERTASVGDVVMVTLEGQSSVGTEAITSHHALAERTASGTASVVDNVQHSSDNSTFADYLTLGTITASAKSFRTTNTGTINRYTRLVYTITSGTATFVAGIGRS